MQAGRDESGTCQWEESIGKRERCGGGHRAAICQGCDGGRHCNHNLYQAGIAGCPLTFLHLAAALVVFPTHD